MYKKLNIKYLLYILGVLVIVLLLVMLVDYKNNNRSFRSKIIDADTASINSITIYPKKANQQPLEIYHEGKNWNVKSGNRKYLADPAMVKNMLAIISTMSPEQILATKKSAWKQFDVDDSSSTRVVIQYGKNNRDELFIGNISYKVPKNQSSYYGYGQQTKISTYVRVDNDDNVYSVDGFLAMTFRLDINDYRIKDLVPKDKSEWTKLTFTYPSDSSFVLSKEKGKWNINNQPADSLAVERYLSSLSMLSSTDFVDAVPVQGNPAMEVKVESYNTTKPFQIEAYKSDTTYYVTSTYNSGTWFNGGKAKLVNKIFVSGKKFIPFKK